MDKRNLKYPGLKRWQIIFSILSVTALLSSFFILKENLFQAETSKNHLEVLLVQPQPPDYQTEYNEYEYEEWLSRKFEQLALLRYQEKEMLLHKIELFRIQQHNIKVKDYDDLLNQCLEAKPPSRYLIFHKAFTGEIWLAKLMHEHYLTNYPVFKEHHYEKTKKHYLWLKILENEHPKMLYRWLLHERSVYQSNILDK